MKTFLWASVVVGILVGAAGVSAEDLKLRRVAVGGDGAWQVMFTLTEGDQVAYDDPSVLTPEAFEVAVGSSSDDLAPVVAFLREDLGASRAEVRALVQAYPRVLGYDVEARLGPLVACLSELGVKDPVALLQARPSLLGLDPGEALQRIVDYLRSTGESPEAILQYLETSL